MWMLTEEKKNELLKQRDSKIAELDHLKRKTPQDLWRDDLDAFVKKLDEVEEKERKDEQGVKKEKKETVRWIFVLFFALSCYYCDLKMFIYAAGTSGSYSSERKGKFCCTGCLNKSGFSEN